MGENAEANVSSIREIVNQALAWELRSGATFEGEKTALVQFTRNLKPQSRMPVKIKGTEVLPKDEVKILGVIMDSRLRFKNHIKKISMATAYRFISIASSRSSMAPVREYRSRRLIPRLLRYVANSG